MDGKSSLAPKPPHAQTLEFVYTGKQFSLHSIVFPKQRNTKMGQNYDVCKSKGSVSQLMDDFYLINSVEKVEAMVNSIQKGVENVLRK